MFDAIIWHSKRSLAAALMLAVLLTDASASTASPVLKQSELKQSELKQSVFQQTDAQAALRRPQRSSIIRRPPRPPRRLPPNLVQPGGGLDVALQSCDPKSQPLTALVPVENPVFTASAHPTFLFYLPDAPERVDYAEFILLSADEKEVIYTVQFVPEQTGVVSIALPSESSPALEVAQAYHWYLNVYCEGDTFAGDPGSGANNPSVNGWVQRLPSLDSSEALLTHHLNESGMPEVWYDAIAQVAETLAAEPVAQNHNPQNRMLWENLLAAVGLEEVADKPVVGAIRPE